MSEKFNVWKLSLDDYIKIVELSQERGIRPGESMQIVFDEYVASKQGNVEFLGVSEKDCDLLAGEAREAGMKVFNMKEFERQNGNK